MHREWSVCSLAAPSATSDRVIGRASDGVILSEAKDP
jgi:hypothetical protein